MWFVESVKYHGIAASPVLNWQEQIVSQQAFFTVADIMSNLVHFPGV
jgi:hypothetical protein